MDKYSDGLAKDDEDTDNDGRVFEDEGEEYDKHQDQIEKQNKHKSWSFRCNVFPSLIPQNDNARVCNDEQT